MWFDERVRVSSTYQVLYFLYSLYLYRDFWEPYSDPYKNYRGIGGIGLYIFGKIFGKYRDFV